MLKLENKQTTTYASEMAGWVKVHIHVYFKKHISYFLIGPTVKQKWTTF